MRRDFERVGEVTSPSVGFGVEGHKTSFDEMVLPHFFGPYQ